MRSSLDLDHPVIIQKVRLLLEHLSVSTLAALSLSVAAVESGVVGTIAVLLWGGFNEVSWETRDLVCIQL